MGWAATPQEVFDNTLINFRVGEDSRIMLPQLFVRWLLLVPHPGQGHPARVVTGQGVLTSL